MSLRILTGSLWLQTPSQYQHNPKNDSEKGFTFVQSNEKYSRGLLGKSEIYVDSRIGFMPESQISDRGSFMAEIGLRRKSSEKNYDINYTTHLSAKPIDVAEYLKKKNTTINEAGRNEKAEPPQLTRNTKNRPVEPIKQPQNDLIISIVPLTKRKKTLKKSNAYKNFANRFRIYFNKFQNVKDLFQQEENIEKSHKNISDNLNKKIKYEKRAQKLDDMESMLSHKNFSHIIVRACRRFLRIYPKQIQQSTKMQNPEENTKILKDIEGIIQRLQKII